MNTKPKRTCLQFRADLDMILQLDRLAEADFSLRSDVARRALERGLDILEREAAGT